MSSTEHKAAVYLGVAKMVEQYTNELGTSATPAFVASLIEFVYNQIVLLGEDLEMFAAHGGREVVNTADVYLAVRRNEALEKALRVVHESLAGLQVQTDE
ncbi:hypothetical protein PUMCH_004075 [Australozyma saopauloensis]|uniref:MHF histone-fold complex subunit 1 n=1 Tax=Australozyma saopauloensis TaxID=291208 RepID=A0AAX4HGF3_9ASCO|nr:hypothetical protein PUMCH_004075 [[Candida] saopauloensis]